MSKVIPVEYNGKILIIKLREHYSALYPEPLTGDVIAICDEPDDAAYIIDLAYDEKGEQK